MNSIRFAFDERQRLGPTGHERRGRNLVMHYTALENRVHTFIPMLYRRRRSGVVACIAGVVCYSTGELWLKLSPYCQISCCGGPGCVVCISRSSMCSGVSLRQLLAKEVEYVVFASFRLSPRLSVTPLLRYRARMPLHGFPGPLVRWVVGDPACKLPGLPPL